MIDLDELVDCIFSLLYNPEDTEEVAAKLGKIVMDYDSYPYDSTEKVKALFEEHEISTEK